MFIWSGENKNCQKVAKSVKNRQNTKTHTYLNVLDQCPFLTLIRQLYFWIWPFLLDFQQRMNQKWAKIWDQISHQMSFLPSRQHPKVTWLWWLNDWKSLIFIKSVIFVMYYHLIRHCTEVRFASFLSGEFTTMATINPPESNLIRRTSVRWVDRWVDCLINQASDGLSIILIDWK